MHHPFKSKPFRTDPTPEEAKRAAELAPIVEALIRENQAVEAYHRERQQEDRQNEARRGGQIRADERWGEEGSEQFAKERNALKEAYSAWVANLKPGDIVRRLKEGYTTTSGHVLSARCNTNEQGKTEYCLYLSDTPDALWKRTPKQLSALLAGWKV